ncbi:hypothetical protein KOW79_000228 [Hemibagrus wyckioides]|uniref:Little elongation complex subunit 1 C-terminal domain-containing protein n=1 Tax=Hemibagrus wyckioides TaxID=337641 RepID=A0A9D3P9G2_9TELE|nr:hypothetical protein KOW79_000228 [Hemibagrus wyckioides]
MNSKRQNTNTCCLHLRQQIRALEDDKAKQYEEIQSLKREISDLNKCMRLMQENLVRQSFTKEKRCSSTQTGNEQEVDKALFMCPSSRSAPLRSSNIPVNKTIRFSFTGFTHRNVNQMKRPRSSMPSPTNAKRQRLDSSSDPASLTPLPNAKPSDSTDVAMPKSDGEEDKTKDSGNTTQSLISTAFTTLQESCFDVLPTIRGRLLPQISELPGLTDEEDSVISYFSENPALAEKFMSAILCKIKAEGAGLKHGLLQFLCRVYVSLCQKTGDFHKAHGLAYRLLKEDFPEAPKLILVMMSAWPSVFAYTSSLCQAIHTVTKLKAEGDILVFLSEYLHWDEPPSDIHRLISCTLKCLLMDSSLTFRNNSWFGVDLCPATWEYVFSLELLCSQLDWSWTFTNIISQEIWPTLNTWLRRQSSQQRAVRDVCVAAILRLLGRLGQLGLKENQATLVQSLAKAVNQFGNHKLSKDAAMPWEVQLSVLYATHDLAPSNPKEALVALASWQKGITCPVPPAIKRCTTQIGTLCQKTKEI